MPYSALLPLNRAAHQGVVAAKSRRSMTSTAIISPLLPDHWPVVARIYEEGIATSDATFQTTVPTWEEWDKSHALECRLVAMVNEELAGWAAVSPVSSRCVYGGVAEVSVYVGKDFRGKGIGLLLLKGLIAESEKQGFWTLQAGIFPENTASIAVHNNCGFRIVGGRERIGQMHTGHWRDTILMERRSKVGGN